MGKNVHQLRTLVGTPKSNRTGIFHSHLTLDRPQICFKWNLHQPLPFLKQHQNQTCYFLLVSKHTITETNKRSRSSSSDDHTQPPSKIRKESQDIVNKLNGLNTILTKNVAKGISKVFHVHSNVKGSIAMHTGGVMYVYSDKWCFVFIFKFFLVPCNSIQYI